MYTLQDKLSDLSLSDLYKIYNSNKEYIYIDISVFNVGASINVILTNNYDKYIKKVEGYNYNGYNIFLENSMELHYTVEEMIIKKYHSLVNEWTKNCYYYTFEDFIKTYKLSSSKFEKLRSIYNKNCNKYKI